jgi:hypothetical protein
MYTWLNLRLKLATGFKGQPSYLVPEGSSLPRLEFLDTHGRLFVQCKVKNKIDTIGCTMLKKLTAAMKC